MQPDYIRNKITELRLKKGIAEHRMSLDLGHSRSYIQGISTGRALPSMTEFLAICDYLGVTPHDFFDETCSNTYLYSLLKNEARTLTDEDLSLLLSIIERLKK